jgi:hypothetical protein
VDRRQFLIHSGRIGLAAGLGALAAACASVAPIVTVPLPTGSAVPSPTTTTPRAPGPTPRVPPAIARINAIAEENARPGTREWLLTKGRPAIGGFLSQASAAPGDALSLHVSSAVPFDVEWYRLGWYQGRGARRLRVDRGLPANHGARRKVDPVTGMAEADWMPVLRLSIPAEWPSGEYAVVLRPRLGAASYVPFVVRPGGGAVASVLVVSAAATWQAYNDWGGASLYHGSTANAPTITHGRRAVRVSFDRPYALAQGAGYQQRWELQFVRWLEREGRGVDYAADIDLELHPEVLAGRQLIVFPGHHEYWSRPMRSALEGAVAAGTNVAFLSANEIYWQVRLDPSPLGPARRVTCYRDPRLDPIALRHPALATCHWRDAPVSDPEALLVGQMYGHVVRRPGDWVVRNASHWLYEGTGLADGDHLVNLVGQEYDTYFPEFANPGTVLLAQGPVNADMTRDPDDPLFRPAVHTATMYTATSGATVFAAGTFQWSWAIDRFGERAYRGVKTPYDDRVVRMTRNLFDRLGDGPG